MTSTDYSATGGTVTTDGLYTVHIFTVSGTFVITIDSSHTSQNLTEALRINNLGNVGIGTATPTNKLQIIQNAGGATSYRALHWSNNYTASPMSLGYLGGDDESFNSGAIFLLQNGVQANGVKITANGNSYFNGGNVGIGRTPVTNKLEVEGNASKTVSGSWVANSDSRIKTDISGIDNAVDTLSLLRPVKFKYTDEYMALHPSLTDKYYYNFIAQEFQQVFPSEVTDSGDTLPNGDHILALDPYVVTPYLVKAIQEQQVSLNTQKTRIGNLEASTLDTNSLITKSHTEVFTSTQTLEQNELVSINPTSNGDVIRTNTDNDKTVVGVVTEKVTNETDQYRVQYEGKTQTKVSILNGAITSGDLLTTSATNPGTVVKATPESTVTIGLALESTTVDGVIDVMLQTNYSSVSIGVGTLTPTQEQILSGFSLDVDGHLIVKGDLEIQGKLKITNDNSKGVNIPINTGNNYIQIKFVEPRENDSYAVTITPNWLTNTAITEKSATGFKIEFGISAPTNAKIDWLVID